MIEINSLNSSKVIPNAESATGEILHFLHDEKKVQNADFSSRLIGVNC